MLCEKQLSSVSSTQTHIVGDEPNGCVSIDYASNWCVSKMLQMSRH
jgi:hypothetical protein